MKYTCIILKFLALHILIYKIKEWKFHNLLCHSLPYFSVYPEEKEPRCETSDEGWVQN